MSGCAGDEPSPDRDNVSGDEASRFFSARLEVGNIGVSGVLLSHCCDEEVLSHLEGEH